MSRTSPLVSSLAGVLVSAGALHFAVPAPYASIVPRVLGAPRVWVALSGLAEVACGVGVALPRSRRGAAWASAALFVAVFPANVQMALDADGGGGLATNPVVAWGRLPLQVPLVLWAVAVARGARG